MMTIGRLGGFESNERNKGVNMERRWSVRAYKEGDEKRIFELTKVVYPKKRYNKEKWMQWWNWEFKNSPTGSAIILVAEQEDKIIGQLALIPLRMKIKNQNVRAAIELDDMTHPDYRRQGIFSTLIGQASIIAKEEDIKMIYASPTEMAYSVHLRGGRFDVQGFKFLFKPFNLNNILRNYISNRLQLKLATIIGGLIINLFFRGKKSVNVNDLTINQISSFDDSIDDFWRRVSSGYEIIVVRNKEYLNWRYAKISNKNYVIYLAKEKEEVCGYIIIRAQKSGDLTVGDIVDIIAPPNRMDVIDQLISAAIEYFEDEKVDLINTKMIANKLYLKAFKMKGFIIKPRNCHLVMHTSSPEISVMHREAAKHCFIQLGDFIDLA